MASFFKRLKKEARRIEKTVTGKGLLEFGGDVAEALGGVEDFVSDLARKEKSAIEGRLESARLKRLRQRGLINTIVTGRLGAPVGKLGLSTEIGTSERTLLGG